MRLHAEVCARVRRAGDVGGEDAELAGFGADEPDEARAEHSIRRVEELGAEGVEGGKVFGYSGEEGFRDGGLVGRLWGSRVRVSG